MKAVILRAVLYFFIACLPVLVERFTLFADGKATPTGWQIIVIILSSLLSGCIALRAYVDGSFQRHLDDTKQPSP